MSENYKSSTHVVDIEKASPQQIKNLIPIWSEGNPELEKLLYKLIEDGIQTVGCCSGHDTGTSNDFPYVAFKFDRDSKEEILLDFLAKLDNEENKKTQIGLVKDAKGTLLCVINAPDTGRDNGDFFKRINLVYCSGKESISDDKRAKWDALRTLMLDERSGKGYRCLNYYIGDTTMSVIGIKGIEGKTALVGADTVLERADWLKNNPNSSVDYIFSKREIIPIVYPMKLIKDFAKRSKQPLKRIKEAIRKIKDRYLQQNGNEILGEEPEFDE